MIFADIVRDFHGAYDNPVQATANLTTWLVYGAFFSALANFAVVVAAFVVQRRAFDREHRVRDSERAELHIAALNSAVHALELFDRVIGGKDDKQPDFSRSDVIGRMKVMVEYTSSYLALGIINNRVVSTIVAMKTLLERVIQDISDLPTERDRVQIGALDQIYAHRRNLRDGVEQLIKEAFAQPAQSTPIR